MVCGISWMDMNLTFTIKSDAEKKKKNVVSSDQEIKIPASSLASHFQVYGNFQVISSKITSGSPCRRLLSEPSCARLLLPQACKFFLERDPAWLSPL